MKMAACKVDFLCSDDSDAVLSILICYGYGENTSEAVAKITADEKEYQKISFCFIVCIAAAYQ